MKMETIIKEIGCNTPNPILEKIHTPEDVGIMSHLFWLNESCKKGTPDENIIYYISDKE